MGNFTQYIKVLDYSLPNELSTTHSYYMKLILFRQGNHILQSDGGLMNVSTEYEAVVRYLIVSHPLTNYLLYYTKFNAIVYAIYKSCSRNFTKTI